jgi:hypothetical protein
MHQMTNPAAKVAGGARDCSSARISKTDFSQNASTQQTFRIAGRSRSHIDFDRINVAAQPVIPALVARWLPNGRRRGREWISLNPKRNDRRLGSFRVNLTTGRWSDFATGDAGGDVISLGAYLFDLSQPEAARRIAAMLGLPEH